jgi:hypothetical protein
MLRRIVAITFLSIAGALVSGWNASGQVAGPYFRSLASRNSTATPKSAKALAAAGSSFRSLRPVSREDDVDFDEAERFLSRKSFIDRVYDKDMRRNFREHYNNEVLPFEKTVNDPYRRARVWEREAYDQKRTEMARWSAKEVVNDQLRDLFHGADKDSGAVKAFTAMKEISGGGEDRPEEKPLTPEEKIARAHRRDLPVVTQAEEEKVPTKLKTKMNVLRGSGQLVFTNPFVNTSVNLKAGNRDDNIVVEMTRDFRKITLNSHLRYEVDRSLMNFNMNKRITDQISFDMDHLQYTGAKRGDGGEKTTETAKLLYSVGF